MCVRPRPSSVIERNRDVMTTITAYSNEWPLPEGFRKLWRGTPEHNLVVVIAIETFVAQRVALVGSR